MLYFPTKVDLFGSEKEAVQFQGIIHPPGNNLSDFGNNSLSALFRVSCIDCCT